MELGTVGVDIQKVHTSQSPSTSLENSTRLCRSSKKVLVFSFGIPVEGVQVYIKKYHSFFFLEPHSNKTKCSLRSLSLPKFSRCVCTCVCCMYAPLRWLLQVCVSRHVVYYYSPGADFPIRRLERKACLPLGLPHLPPQFSLASFFIYFLFFTPPAVFVSLPQTFPFPGVDSIDPRLTL